jgi:hypothetical protein
MSADRNPVILAANPAREAVTRLLYSTRKFSEDASESALLPKGVATFRR